MTMNPPHFFIVIEIETIDNKNLSEKMQYDGIVHLLTYLGSPILRRVTTTARGVNICRPVTESPPTCMRDKPPHQGLRLLHSCASLQTVCGFFNVPQNLYVQGLLEGAYGFFVLIREDYKGAFHLPELAGWTIAGPVSLQN